MDDSDCDPGDHCAPVGYLSQFIASKSNISGRLAAISERIRKYQIIYVFIEWLLLFYYSFNIKNCSDFVWRCKQPLEKFYGIWWANTNKWYSSWVFFCCYCNSASFFLTNKDINHLFTRRINCCKTQKAI